MLIYILILVFAGLLCFISLAFLIAGLVKSNRKLWVPGLIGFVLFFLFTVAAGYTYAKKQIEYVSSDEFQEETRKAAENWGKNIGNTASGAAEGIASSLDEEAIGKLAEKSGKILGDGVKSMSKGMDESIGKVLIYPDSILSTNGIELGRAEQTYSPEDGYQFGVFLEFKSQFNGKLKLTAYDSEGLKMDVATVELDKEQGDEGVELFKFEHFKPGKSGYCILSE